MAEEITKYGIEIGFEDSLKKLKVFNARMGKSEKARENSILRQITYQKRLNSLMNNGMNESAAYSALLAKSLPRTRVQSPTKPSTKIPKSTPVSSPSINTDKEQLRIKQRIQMIGEQEWINSKHINKAKKEGWRLAQKQVKTKHELNVLAASQKRQAMDMIRLEKQRLKTLQKQGFVMGRMSSSAKQFAGNYIGAFAAVGAATAVTKAGMDYEKLEALMTAVSVDSKEATSNISFLKDESLRLGMSFTEVGRGFAKMLSAKGSMSVDQTKDLFSGFSEASTVLGLTTAETTRTINGLQQMMSKGVVSTEELKLQIAESMPPAMKIFAKSMKAAGYETDGSVAQMLKMIGTGKVMADKLLPHVAKEMHAFANENDALTKMLKSSTKAFDKLKSTAGVQATEFSKNGYQEGLTEFLHSLTDLITENEDLWAALGKVAGATLKVLAVGVDILTPIFKTFGLTLKYLTDVLGDFSFIIAGFASLLVIGRFKKLLGLMKLFRLETIATNKAMMVGGMTEMFMTGSLFKGGKLKGLLKLIGAVTGITTIIPTLVGLIASPVGLLGMAVTALGVTFEELFNFLNKGVKKDGTQERGILYDPTKKGGGGIVDNMWDYFSEGAGYKNTADLGKNTVGSGTLDSFKWLQKNITTAFIGGSALAPIKALIDSQRDTSVNVQINLDGEKIGEAVSKSNASKSAWEDNYWSMQQ